jgi:hypothetical protein
MNIVQEENTMRQDDRMSYANPRWYGGRPVHIRRAMAGSDRAMADQSQQMRRIGFAVCIASAAITLLSAALIAIHF